MGGFLDFVVEEDDGLLLVAIPEDKVPPGVGGDNLLAGDDGDVDPGPDLLVGVFTGALMEPMTITLTTWYRILPMSLLAQQSYTNEVTMNLVDRYISD